MVRKVNSMQLEFEATNHSGKLSIRETATADSIQKFVKNSKKETCTENWNKFVLCE